MIVSRDCQKNNQTLILLDCSTGTRSGLKSIMRLAFVSLSLLTLNIRHKTLKGIYSLKFVPGGYKVVQVNKVSIH